jgi:hypothetical protein
MLRNRLFKRFGKDGLQEPVDNIPSQGIKTADTYPTIEELASRVSNPNYRPLTQSMLGIGTVKDEAGYEKQNGELNINAGMFEPKKNFGIPTYNFSIPGSRMSQDMRNQEQTLREGEVSSSTPENISTAQNISGVVKNQYNPKPKKKDLNLPGIGDEITLGLAALDSVLGYNQDLQNERTFNQSLQQRNSKPLYDYNYMYGRTSSGGTERNNIVQAEMGAQINKRYSSGGENNVEIEGGEFIQLPNFETEMATGPSHENGGIPTNLPDETRVYSNSLKPEGSKKTFAQMAKNYDITSYKKTLDNPFAKQVDKDTASIMMQRNQRILDDLFKDQQYLNGDSNGELEARNGASINNAGFKALPQSVQDKILAEMQYGGNVQGGETLQMAKGGTPVKKNPQPSADSLPPQIRSYAKWDAGFQKKDGSVGAYRLEVPAGLDQDALTSVAKAAESYGISNLVQTSNTRMQGAPGIKGFHSGLSPQDFEKKIVAESLGKEQAGKLNELDTRKKAFELMGVSTEGYDINDASKLYGDEYFREKSFYPAFQKYLPEGKFRPQAGNDAMFGFEHYDAIKAKTPPGGEIPPKEKPIEPETPKYDAAGNPITGKYIPGKFPLYQALPEAMGLAQAQEIYPYAIPEIDAPYLRPQTLNIQSELQDIDNMGTATMRAGADPLEVYIAGLDAKQKAFQAKQNYDADARAGTDKANADMSFNADRLNQGAFDSVYNTQIANARDAQSYEKQAALANLVSKKAAFTQDENLKALGIPIVAPGFDVTSEGRITLPKGYRANFATAKKGMYKKPKY